MWTTDFVSEMKRPDGGTFSFTSSATDVKKYVLTLIYLLRLQIYIFHVETHPHFRWYTQCVTYHSFPTPAWERLYTIFGMVFTYLVRALYCSKGTVIHTYEFLAAFATFY